MPDAGQADYSVGFGEQAYLRVGSAVIKSRVPALPGKKKFQFAMIFGSLCPSTIGSLAGEHAVCSCNCPTLRPRKPLGIMNNFQVSHVNGGHRSPRTRFFM